MSNLPSALFRVAVDEMTVSPYQPTTAYIPPSTSNSLDSTSISARLHSSSTHLSLVSLTSQPFASVRRTLPSQSLRDGRTTLARIQPAPQTILSSPLVMPSHDSSPTTVLPNLIAIISQIERLLACKFDLAYVTYRD